MRALYEAHDVVFFDLDGVVYIGPNAVPHAAEVIAELGARGVRCCFVTNNASRTPEEVARHLTDLGIPASSDDVVTGSQAGASVLCNFVAPGSRVLAVGGPGVSAALVDHGFVPVHSSDERPDAVMQGYGPDVGWRELAEVAFALSRGIPWIATNLDATFPTPRGIAPGNGSLVAAISHATGLFPDAVAGKPEGPLFVEALSRTGAMNGLMVGDRLDTDIEGGNRAGLQTLLVLTGVCSAQDVLRATEEEIPTFVGADLRCLLDEPVRWSDFRGGTHV